MPRRKQNRKPRKTRKPRRKNRVAQVVTTKNGFPDRLRTKLIYGDVVDINSAGATTLQQYRLNSLYDPDVTSAGSDHQPMGFDQLVTGQGPYNRYRVAGCSWEVTMTPPSSTSCKLSVYPSNNTSAPANMFDASEQPMSKTRIILTQSTRPITIKGYISLKKLYGKRTLSNAGIDQAIVNTNPSETAYLNIYASSLDQLTSLGNLDYSVKLTYYCELFDKSNLGGS